MFLSVILNATGRQTFYYSLLSVKDQLRPMDEFIVVSAKPNPSARKLYLNTLGLRGGGYFEDDDPFSVGTTHSHGVWLVYLDDNSLLTPGALDAVREAAQLEELKERPSPLMFRSRFSNGIVVQDVLVPYNQNVGHSAQETILRQGSPVEHDYVIKLVIADVAQW